jgi:hypothetical protein
MNAANQKKKFEEDINHIVAAFANECRSNKRVALKLKISSVFLSATITVCLGLKSTSATWGTVLSDVALVFSALISVLSAYEAFFDPRSIWIRETIVFSKLRNLKREFEFWAAGCEGDALEPAEAEKLLEFKDKLDQILVESLKHWMKIRGAPDSDREPQAPNAS